VSPKTAPSLPAPAVLEKQVEAGQFPVFARRPALLLALLSGFLYFVAFPGVEVWPLAFVALVPLIVALDGQTPRRALLLGWVAGLTMTSLGFYWLLNMLQTFSGFPTPICAIFLLLLCGYQGGRIGLLGWLSARGRARGYPRNWVFVLGFVASETVYPLIFPWSYAGVVHQIPALLQMAELGGPIAVALPLVLANLGFAEIWRARRARQAFPVRRVLLYLAVPVVSALYGALRIPAVDARTESAPHAHVGLVQANMSLFAKRQDVNEGLRRHLDLTRKLTSEGPLDLVVWSETSVMAPVWEEDLERTIPRVVGRHLHVPALFGSVLARPVDDARKHVFFNSALLTDPAGKVVGRYDKHYRLPFGEFLPLGDQFPIFYEWSPNSGHFAEGTSLMPLRVGEHQIAAFICYEDVIPSFVRSIVNSGEPDLLANLTNDAWFGDTTEPWIHLALAQLRAVEHRRFFVRSTNSGISAVVDPVGRVVAHTEPFEQTALRAPIAWLRGSTPYGVWGDAPWWALSLASFALAFVSRRGATRRGSEGASPSLSIPANEPGPSSHLSGSTNEFRIKSHARLSRPNPPSE
jgi:apolipoprotein N-acyltransferase